MYTEERWEKKEKHQKTKSMMMTKANYLGRKIIQFSKRIFISSWKEFRNFN